MCFSTRRSTLVIAKSTLPKRSAFDIAPAGALLITALMIELTQSKMGGTGDEPPHQIRSYTLLFLLFLHFPYIADPPLRTSAPTRPPSHSHDNHTRSIGPISLI